MQATWINNNCDQVKAYFTFYTVPQAALLWCGVPESGIEEELSRTKPISMTSELGKSILSHPYLKCVEPCCRAMQKAINDGKLKVGRDGGESFFASDTNHVAYSRRTLNRVDLKEWIIREFPSQKPNFLFDEIERNTHPSINADSYRSLQADKEALARQLKTCQSEKGLLQNDIYRFRAEITQTKAQTEIIKPLQTRERDGLLRTIGAIALMLVERGGHRMGTVDDPIFKQLAESICKFMAKESLSDSDGMSPETLRKRLKEGVDTLKGA